MATDPYTKSGSTDPNECGTDQTGSTLLIISYYINWVLDSKYMKKKTKLICLVTQLFLSPSFITHSNLYYFSFSPRSFVGQCNLAWLISCTILSSTCKSQVGTCSEYPLVAIAGQIFY